ncbi:SEC-C domain-containing protein [Clostridium algoriphilum]|nr:SEC-C metal-binding domain-containing protein [Clostridium algoriphilum]MCB2295153.1 SEC-C domain-containing protein [Clostridium algoriphilum]
MVNNKLQGHILEIIDKQMRDNDPKCTKEVFVKLIGIGYEQNNAKKMIAVILIEELYYIMKNEELFNEERYSNNLANMLEHKDEENKEELEKIINDEIIQSKITNENKIGRNSLCSCGSGKKYKNCCGK